MNFQIFKIVDDCTSRTSNKCSSCPTGFSVSYKSTYNYCINTNLPDPGYNLFGSYIGTCSVDHCVDCGSSASDCLACDSTLSYYLHTDKKCYL